MEKNLNNSKLIAYSAAAGAALAIAPNAFGTIIHNTVDIDFGHEYGSTNLTLEGSTAEMKFANGSSRSFHVLRNGNSASVYVSGSTLLASLNLGLYVSSNTNTPNYQTAFFSISIIGKGNWNVIGDNKMFGMSFLLEGGDQKRVYGWIAVEKIATGAGKITAWAYEDDGTKIPVGAIPEPISGLALLALGAAGIARYRRK